MRLSVATQLVRCSSVRFAIALLAFTFVFSVASLAAPAGPASKVKPSPQTLIPTTTAMSFSPSSLAVGSVTTVTLTVTPAAEQ